MENETKEQLVALLNAEKQKADRWMEVAKRRLAAPRAADGERLRLGEKVEVGGKPGWVEGLHVYADGCHQVVVRRRSGCMGTWYAKDVVHAPYTVEDELWDMLEQSKESEDWDGLVADFSKRLRLVE